MLAPHGDHQQRHEVRCQHHVEDDGDACTSVSRWGFRELECMLAAPVHMQNDSMAVGGVVHRQFTIGTAELGRCLEGGYNYDGQRHQRPIDHLQHAAGKNAVKLYLTNEDGIRNGNPFRRHCHSRMLQKRAPRCRSDPRASCSCA